MVWSDGPVDSAGGHIAFGVRGIASFELRARGANRSLHSGNWGGVVPNPLWTLVHLLASMRDPGGRITVEGFGDAVEPLGATERVALDRLPVDVEAVKAELGLAELDAPAGRGFAERLAAWPTLTINGLHGGYGGEGTQTVLPSAAVAKCDVRLVHAQRAGDVYERLRRTSAATPPGSSSSARARWSRRGPRWTRPSPRRSAGMAAAQGADPLLVPVLGGSLPLHVFTGVLGLPTFGIPLGNPDQANHAPDENLDLDRFHTGVKTAAAVLAKLGLSEGAHFRHHGRVTTLPPGTPAPPWPARDRPAGRAPSPAVRDRRARGDGLRHRHGGPVVGARPGGRPGGHPSSRPASPAPGGGRGRRLRHPGRRAGQDGRHHHPPDRRHHRPRERPGDPARPAWPSYHRLPLTWHQEHSAGELLSRAEGDLDAASEILLAAAVRHRGGDHAWRGRGLAIPGRPVPGHPGHARGPGHRGPQPGLPAPGGAPTTLGQERLGDMSAVAHESFDGALVVKALQAEEAAGRRFADKAERLRDARIEAARVTANFEAGLDVLPAVTTVALLVVGVWRIEQGAITAGTLVGLINLFALLIWPLRLIGVRARGHAAGGRRLRAGRRRSWPSRSRRRSLAAAAGASGGLLGAGRGPGRVRLRGRRRGAVRGVVPGPGRRHRGPGRAHRVGQVDPGPAPGPPRSPPTGAASGSAAATWPG